MKARDLPLGIPEIHEHGDPEVIVNRDGTVQDTEDGQPIKFRLHRCTEDIEFGHESSQRRNACHGEEKDGHGNCQKRVFESDPCIIIDQGIFFSLLPEEDDHGKGTDVHKGISHEIEKNA